MNLPIFSDHKLKGGELYEQKFPRAISRSVCMVMIYTPTYFDADYDYCAREFLAMEQAEKERFSTLTRYNMPTPGMIIPIILKGRPPERVRAKRDCRYNFGSFLLSETNIAIHPNYATWFDEIGNYIRDVWDIIRHVDWQSEAQAEIQTLPSGRDVSLLLDEILEEIKLPFPGIRSLRRPPADLV